MQINVNYASILDILNGALHVSENNRTESISSSVFTNVNGAQLADAQCYQTWTALYTIIS